MTTAIPERRAGEDSLPPEPELSSESELTLPAEVTAEQIISDDLALPSPAPCLEDTAVTASASPEVSEPESAPPNCANASAESVETTAVRRRSLFTPQPDPSVLPDPDVAASDAAKAAEAPGDPLEQPANDSPAAAPTASDPAAADAPVLATSSDLLPDSLPESTPDAAAASADAPTHSAATPPPVWKERTPVKPAPPRSEDDILLEGSVVVGHPASRAVAHWLGVLLAFVGLPLAWFCLNDGASRLIANAQTYQFALTLRGGLELGAGIVALLIALWPARRSSVGMFVLGIIATLISLPTLVVPTVMNSALTPFLTHLAQQSSLGEDIAKAWWRDAVSGRLLAAGIALILIGCISHSARKAGRREQEVIDRIHHHTD